VVSPMRQAAAAGAAGSGPRPAQADRQAKPATRVAEFRLTMGYPPAVRNRDVA
jgi:hypothetical protein